MTDANAVDHALPPEFLVALAAQAAIFEERIEDLENELGTLQFRLKLHESAALHSSAAQSHASSPPTTSRAPSTASTAARGESHLGLGIPARAARGSVFPGRASRNPSIASTASPGHDEPAPTLAVPTRRATSVVNLGWDGTVTEVVGRRRSVARPPSLVPKAPSHTSLLAQSPSQAALNKSPSATELARPKSLVAKSPSATELARSKSLVAKIDVDRANANGEDSNVSPPLVLPHLLMARRNVSFGPIAETAGSEPNAGSDEEDNSISHPIPDAALPASNASSKVRISTPAKGPFSAATVVPVDETDSAASITEDEAAAEAMASEDTTVVERVILDPPPLLTGLYQMLTASKMNMLLVLLPLAIASQYLSWAPDATFVLSLLAILPLAGLLGESTEEIALYTSDATGGLLNATFGNAVEIIISITAMRASLFHVVQDAMLGSILSNLLLVLGTAFFAAGIQFQMCDFNSTAAQTTSSLLLLATMGIITPSIYALTAGSITVSTPFNQNAASATLSISRAAAVVLFSVYIGYLFFQIKTHSHLYEDEEENDEGEDKQPKLSPFWACLVLTCVTALVALVANGLIGSIEAASHNWGISSTFSAIILIPIAGNAAEHISAIQAAMDGRINLAIGIAVGSSVQIACGVFPFLVILGAIVGRPLDFTFQAFETVVTFICVIIVNAVVQDGESTWLEGFICISCYIIVAVSFFFR